ncbi:dTMP kinase [Zavarzinia sp.]|uniref:dTMP kinase n=1 Tax=Zavarzinia sp. TaxID=2027920 RepID=UPI00356414B0
MTGGRFIVLEGGEGAGKTGTIAFLAAELRARGRDVVTTREPGGTPEGAALRRLLLAGEGFDWTPEAELLLMTADRAQHVARVVRPALAAGRIVISDRYAGSTLAYQGAGRGLDRELILDLHRRALNDLWPDLTLVLDVPPEIGLRRSLARLGSEGVDEGRFEGLDLDFHRRVRQSFLDLAAAAGPGARVIDATATPETVKAEALAAVLGVLG